MYLVIILASVAIFIISSCGCLGHVLSLRAVNAISEKKTTFLGLFILMTVADIALLVLGTGQQVYDLAIPENHHLPEIQAVMDYISSIALVAAAGLSIDRYLAVKTTTHFQTWNKPNTMVFIVVVVMTISCVITPWPSHFTPDPMCGTSKSVMASNAFTYLTSVTLVVATVGVTCSLSRWILKMETRVAAVETQPPQHTCLDKKNHMSSAMAIRWVILVEVLSCACLASISFISLIYHNECGSTVSSQWWYRLLQASPKASKPFLFMLVSRFFRQSITASDTNRHARRPTIRRESTFSHEEGSVHIHDSSAHLNGTSGHEMFPVTNPITNQDGIGQNQLRAVAAIQGRPYPFTSREPVETCRVTTRSTVSPTPNIADIIPTHADTANKPVFSLHELHLQPSQDPIQALMDRPVSRNEPLSVSFTCKLQFNSTNSCPDLKEAVSNDDFMNQSPLTRERTQTVVASHSTKPDSGYHNLYLPPLTKTQLHANNWKSSANLEVKKLEGDVNESTDCIPTLNNVLCSVTTAEGKLERQDSMCNLAEVDYSLSLVSLNDSKTNIRKRYGSEKDADIPLQSPASYGIPGIVLINDENVSTQVLEAVVPLPIAQSEEDNEKTEEAITDNQEPSVVSPRSKDSVEAGNACLPKAADTKRNNVNIFNFDSVFDTEETLGRNESVKCYRRRSVCSRYSLDQALVNIESNGPRQRLPSAPSIYGKVKECMESIDSCLEGLSMTPSLPGLVSFRRLSTVKFSKTSDYPPELKLAFCTPRQSVSSRHSLLKTEGRDSDSKELTALPTEYHHLPDTNDSPVECIDILSTLSSPQHSPPRKASVSVYDPDSHVYLGSLGPLGK